MFTFIDKRWSRAQLLLGQYRFKSYIHAIRSSLNSKLFDATPEFWSYHITGISLMVTFSFLLNAIFLPAYLWDFYVLANATWGSAFFFSGLVIRSHYKSANWETQTHTKMLLRTFASCLFFGFCIVVIMLFFSLTFTADDFYRAARLKNPDATNLGAISRFFFSNWFVSSFHIMCWMMLYIGITSRRKTKQVEVDNLRLQNSLKEAELSSLSNQLNPHFLFNALNNIRFMIHEDANTAETMLMSLSSVLRYSLDSSKNEKVLFKDELEISDRYIDLIQIQFEERLKFERDIPNALLHCELPPMVLQMLLENAVKHGIDNIQEGGKIIVKARLESNIMIVSVSNDLPKDYSETTSELGIGLFNIGQRLDLLYSGQGSIETNISNDRFHVTMKIPQNSK